MSEETAIVFDIQKFSVHDGPGIRTNVFLKGCPLRCIWCHNPESQKTEPELFYNAEKCLHCGTCVPVCPEQAHSVSEQGHVFDRTRCRVCGKCAELCPASALELCGKRMTVSAVFSEVLKDLPFYKNSGGGMTLSGGEPMMHFAFSLALLRMARENPDPLDTAIETCGFAPAEEYKALLPYVDHFLFDIKMLDEARHVKFTGKPLDVILKSLRFLDDAGAEIVFRCPLIPGLNDAEGDLLKIAELANSLRHVAEINPEPYHPLGVSKSERLGRKPDYSAPFAPKDYAEKMIDFLQKHTSVPVRKS